MSFRGRNSCLIKTSPSFPSGTNEAEPIKLKAAPCLWLASHVASALREQTLGLCATTSRDCTYHTESSTLVASYFCNMYSRQWRMSKILQPNNNIEKKKAAFLSFATWRRMPIKESVFWWLMTRGPRQSCDRPF